jgi:hypothetical protein
MSLNKERKKKKVVDEILFYSFSIFLSTVCVKVTRFFPVYFASIPTCCSSSLQNNEDMEISNEFLLQISPFKKLLDSYSLF